MEKIAFVSTENPLGADGQECVLDVHVSAESVVKLDVLTESDPFCVLMLKNQNNEFVEFDRTEIIWNDPNPKWAKCFQARYVFETLQPIRFAVYDGDKVNSKLSECTLVGTCDTDMQQLVMNTSSALSYDLKIPGNEQKRGTLKIDSIVHTSSRTMISGVIETKDVAKQRIFGWNNLFFQFSKIAESGSEIVVHRSLTMQRVNSPTFPPFLLDQGKLCGDDLEAPIVLSIYDYKDSSSATLVGKTQGNLKSFMESVGTFFDVRNEKNEVTGNVRFQKLTAMPRLSVVNYLQSGVRMNIIPAIDYSSSNGDPTCSYSLHYSRGSTPNKYQQCLLAVGSILCPLDADQEFEPLLFGADISCCVTSMCYPLTLDKSNPTVHGLDGIMQAYKDSVEAVSFSGPTCFAEIIKEARLNAEKAWENNHTYTVLFILTDGCIGDEDETIEQVVLGSKTALSIIIVGIGDADFDTMEMLDADTEPLVYNGMVMERDIVQFVPYRDFEARGKEALAAAVLAEIPTQLAEFCAFVGYSPEVKTQ